MIGKLGLVLYQSTSGKIKWKKSGAKVSGGEGRKCYKDD
jgi:hypothetical protein